MKESTQDRQSPPGVKRASLDGSTASGGRRSRPMSRASTGGGGWDSESAFGFDSDDSDDDQDAELGTTLFSNVKGAWDFRSKVASSPEKEGERFMHRRLSSALAANN